jgi:hypothetical protein
MMTSVVTFGITTVDLPSSDCNIVYNFITASEPISGGLVDAEVEPGFTCRAQAISNAGYEFSHWSIEAGGLDFPIFDYYGSPYHHSEIIYDDVITVRDSAPVDIVCTLELKPVVDVMITAVFVAVNQPIPDNDGDGIDDDQDIDDDNDGIPDIRDETPLVYTDSHDVAPDSLVGYVSLTKGDESSGYIEVNMYVTDQNALWLDPSGNYRYIYSWDRETLIFSTSWDSGMGLFSTEGVADAYDNFTGKTNDVIYPYSHTTQGSPESPYTSSGYGVIYDGRLDLDENGIPDAFQVRSGSPLPSPDSDVDVNSIIEAFNQTTPGDLTAYLPDTDGDGNPDYLDLDSNDTDGDSIPNYQDIDDDNDGIADVSDEFPLIFDVGDGDTPESLEGYVQIYFAEWWSAGGVWYPTSDSAFTWINRRYPSANYQGIYQWDKETRSYISNNTNTIYLNFEEKENDVFFEFTYTVQFSPESTSTIPDHGGGGFFYDARFDLDNNGVSDGLQISSGDAFPAVDSSISLRDIYDSLHSGNSGAGLIPIDILNAYIELNTSKYSLEEIKDLRLGSVMMAVQNGQANLTLSVQESTDLNTWSEASEASIQIPIDAAQSTKFFRFAMPE